MPIYVAGGTDPNLSKPGHWAIIPLQGRGFRAKLAHLSILGQVNSGETNHRNRARGASVYGAARWSGPESGRSLALHISLGGKMKTVLAVTLLIGLAACDTRTDRETGRVGESVDTSVTTRATQDTTIVTSDTTVQTDTVTREGEIKRDTAESE